MAEVNIDVAKEESVQTVNTKVGTSSDTASSTPTTLFAGIKGLIAWFTETWTAARAVKLDTIDIISTNTAYSATASSTGSLSQKMAYIISTLIGVTNATGGTATAGTVMAKLNALITWFTGTWTTTRAAKIDTINTSIADIKAKREVSSTGVGATAYSLPSTVEMSQNNIYCISKFVAPISGLYTLNFTISISTARTITLYRNTLSPFTGNIYMGTSIGWWGSDNPSTSDYTSLLTFINSDTVATSKTFSFHLEAGEPIVLLMSDGGPINSITNDITSLTVTYQPEY